jgi:hypothetical protein
MRCVTVEVSQSEVAALEARSYFSEEERDDGAAIKKAIRRSAETRHEQFPLRVTAATAACSQRGTRVVGGSAAAASETVR